MLGVTRVTMIESFIASGGVLNLKSLARVRRLCSKERERERESNCVPNRKKWRRRVGALTRLLYLNSTSSHFDLQSTLAKEIRFTRQMGDKTPSPPSSPPEVASATMPTTTRKRSHEEMNRKGSDVPESSATVIGDLDAATSQTTQDKEETSVPSVSESSTQSKSMGPQPLPSNTASQKPPHSGQDAVPKTQTPQATDTTTRKEATVSASEQHGANGDSSSDGEVNDDDVTEQPDSPILDSEPQDQVDAFNWRDLEQRYHDKMEELNAQEKSIMNEFNGLCDESLLSFAVKCQR